MKKDIIDKFEVLYSSNIRYLRTFILALLAFVGLVVANFAILFNSVKKNIIISGENNITQFAMETNYFLVESVDAVKLAAYEVDRMMNKGSSSDDIHEYLVDQMDAFTGTLDKSFAGSYGVFDGEYIDSIDWVPDEDYVPEERDWYIDAVEAGGDVALVAPYLDAYTGNMMFSVSEMLSDRKSVVSLDISLEGIQKLVEEEVKLVPEEVAGISEASREKGRIRRTVPLPR